MSFYICDIFPHLNKEVKKNIEIQLGIVLRNSYKRNELKKYIVQIFKRKYLVKLKKILNTETTHLLKQMFLEGGFIEKEESTELPFQKEIPLIEFNQYLYIPNELYEATMGDSYFYKHNYMIGALSHFPEKELVSWLTWLERKTKIHSYIKKPIKRNLLSFYSFVLLSPISLKLETIPARKEFDISEILGPLLKPSYLKEYTKEKIPFYQILQKLEGKKRKEIITISNRKLQIEEILPLFLSGKLIPIFKRNQPKKIIVTKELRDIEISVQKKYHNLVSIHSKELKK